MHERTQKMRPNKPKSLWEILVPTHDNDKSPFSIEHHQNWDKRVLEISSGLTISKVTRGRWANQEGEQFWENMIPVRIICTKAQVKRIAKMTISHYDQQAIMCYLVSKKPEIFHR